MSFKEINKDWSDFKDVVVQRGLVPQYDYFIDYININNVISELQKVRLFGADGFLLFSCLLEKNTDDFNDFETNYKNNWNSRLDFRDANGLSRVIPSARPDGTITYFTGAGDNGGLGDGNRILFNIFSSDASKSVDLNFNEDIYIKDGIIQFKDAPFGSYLEVDIVHPQAGVIAKYCTKLWMVGTGQLQLNSEDKAKIPIGLAVRITVYNSDGQDGCDLPANFKVSGIIEMYRANII